MSWENKIVAYFKSRRKKLNITGTTLAERVGISQGSISLMENGKRGMRTDEMIRIAIALDVDLSEMFGKLQRGEPLADPPPNEIEVDGVRYVLAGEVSA